MIIPTNRLVVAITGASGAILGIRLLELLRTLPVETHLVVSDAARQTIGQETDWALEDVLALAHFHYSPYEVGAAIASGSFARRSMIIAPCSIKTLSAVANAYNQDLIARAADVTLKEGQTLILVVREAPLHPGHLRLMLQAAENGAVIFPAAPAFYHRPQSVSEMVDALVGRILKRAGVDNPFYQEWHGN
jgi:4-hydroxy-3-polyprenylbenzoate decarboxylase